MNSNLLDSRHILVISSVHVFNDTRVYYKEIKTLSQAGYKVTEIAVESNRPAPFHENINYMLFKKGNRLKRMFRWIKIYRFIRQSNAAYIHFHDPALLLLLPLLKEKRRKFIYDMHENFPKAVETKAWIPSYLRKPLRKIIPFFEKVALRHCDAVLFAEESYKKDYPFINSIQADVLNFPHLRKQSENDHSKKELQTLIYVGGIEENRGMWEMIEAIKNLKERGFPSISLKLIGPMSDSDRLKVETYLKEYALSDNVLLLGRLPNEEIYGHLEKATIGLCILKPIPNYIESMATKLFEYMSAELPMIISNFPLWKKLMEETETGLCVDPYDQDNITDTIESLLLNTDLRVKMSKNGAFWHREKYNWSKEGEKLLSVYDEIRKKDHNHSRV